RGRQERHSAQGEGPRDGADEHQAARRGATEETIIARVGEGIVTSIGSAADHPDVLENPDHISKAVLAEGLDANTAVEIPVEGIGTSIGSAGDHSDVVENPDHISKAVLAKGLDANTAFEILSIDIADIDVGDNIGAKLQAEQAEADKKRAQAEAEKRRAMAVA